MTAAHLPLLLSWISAPHWQAWWGEPEVELGYIRDMIEGRDSTGPLIFRVDGEPADYIQYWFISDWQIEPLIADNSRLVGLPSGAIGVGHSIGLVEKLSQGLGPFVLRCFTERLAETGYMFIIIDPDPRTGVHRAPMKRPAIA